MSDDATNLEVLAVLYRIVEKCPSLRMLQVLGNAIPSEVAARYNHDMYHLPDDELLGYLLKFEEEIVQR